MTTYHTTNYANITLGALRGQPYSYSSLYLCLLTDMATLTEVSTGSYERRFAGMDVDLTAGRLVNSSEIRFPSTTTSWGLIVGVGFAQSATSEILWGESITPSVNVGVNSQVVIAAGELVITAPNLV